MAVWNQSQLSAELPAGQTVLHDDAESPLHFACTSVRTSLLQVYVLVHVEGEGLGDAVGLGEGDGKGEGDGEGKGDGLGETTGEGLGITDGEGLGETTGEGDGEGKGVTVGLGDGEGVGFNVGVGDGEGEGVGEGVAAVFTLQNDPSGTRLTWHVSSPQQAKVLPNKPHEAPFSRQAGAGVGAGFAWQTPLTHL